VRFAPAIGGDRLLFDFDRFSKIAASVYADSPYSLAEVLEVFRHYFEQYEEYTGAPHPPIRAVQIEPSSAKCRTSMRRTKPIPRWT